MKRNMPYQWSYIPQKQLHVTETLKDFETVILG